MEAASYLLILVDVPHASLGAGATRAWERRQPSIIGRMLWAALKGKNPGSLF
jgi:hypothetical protein